MGGSDWVLHYDCTAKIIITLRKKQPPVFFIENKRQSLYPLEKIRATLKPFLEISRSL